MKLSRRLALASALAGVTKSAFAARPPKGSPPTTAPGETRDSSSSSCTNAANCSSSRHRRCRSWLERANGASSTPLRSGQVLDA